MTPYFDDGSDESAQACLDPTRPKGHKYDAEEMDNVGRFIRETKEWLRTVENVGQISFNREWAMPSHNTFDVPPIAGFVQKYLLKSKVSVDPFARNKRWATYTNDLNPDTSAAEHMDAEDFLRKYRNICPDLVIFDPPYSPSQVVEVYQKVGEKRDGGGGRNGELYGRVRKAIREIATPETIVLSFGWQSAGMGKGWEIIEILLVCHGGAHNDTICVAERPKCMTEELLEL